ncbi:hypothetical protein BJ878DRAFT_62765 [Calycina marina]|uniref:N-acetyltransferase domain-containing protein n=1 Tax=Calycina marina TaxID=1763456 RepID=A0A9P7ZAE0_9HELO|nr:hypothetical protein BJ878DRAFT_62765 [Calycina marina]
MIVGQVAASPIKIGEQLTKEAVSKKCGPQTSEEPASFNAKVSNQGVDAVPPPAIRQSQGVDPVKELADWNGGWAPAPVEWEERAKFDNSYFFNYVYREWAPTLPVGNVNFDLNDPAFASGEWQVVNNQITAALVHPVSIPDLDNSDNQQAQLYGTGEEAIIKWNADEAARQNRIEGTQPLYPNLKNEIQFMDFGPHEHAPKVDCYLRPSQPSDTAQIAAIYNYYVQNSHVTEDQENITESAIQSLGAKLKQEKLPFIVVVKGNAPQSQHSCSGQPKVLILKGETVLGFALAHSSTYGFGGLRTGRSRFNVKAEVFVHHEYLRNKLGRSLMDKLLQCTSLHSGSNAYKWVNPDPSNLVYEVGGLIPLHTMSVSLVGPQTSRSKADDAEFRWKKEFLLSLLYQEQGMLKRASRTTKDGNIYCPTPMFLDNIIYTKYLTTEKEVPVRS